MKKVKLLLLVLTGLIYACDPVHTEFQDTEKAVLYQSSEITEPSGDESSLVVMTWNIKFGGGRIDFFFDCYGNRVLMTQDEVVSNLEGLAAKIRQVDPDILMVQEIDVNSKRAAYVDQLQWLLDHTSLNYGAYASQWKADFIPSDGLGPMDSGIAVLSKYPIIEAIRHSLPKIGEQDALTRYFYLKRAILETHIDVNGTKLVVLNTHLSAYAHDGTKKKQLDILKSLADDLSASSTLVVGGDFNMIPPGSEKVKDFPDSVCTDEEFQADDYSEEVHWLDEFYTDYTPAIPLEDYQADNSRYFTHTTDKNGFWNRKLDYIFTNRSFRNGMVHQNRSSGGMDTMPLSDHAPITAQLIISDR